MNEYLSLAILFGIVRYALPNMILKKHIAIFDGIIVSLCYALAVFLKKKIIYYKNDKPQ